jgi:hypothetical protein
MEVWLIICYKTSCLSKPNIEHSNKGSSFRDPFDGQVEALLSCELQKGVCKETTGIAERRMPSMRPMLLLRFSLPHVDARTILPYL